MKNEFLGCEDGCGMCGVYKVVCCYLVFDRMEVVCYILVLVFLRVFFWWKGGFVVLVYCCFWLVYGGIWELFFYVNRFLLNIF